VYDAAVKSKGNKNTELKMMSIMREYGIKGWRRHQKVIEALILFFRSKRVALCLSTGVSGMGAGFIVACRSPTFPFGDRKWS
jgi:hypothetical protein